MLAQELAISKTVFEQELPISRVTWVTRSTSVEIGVVIVPFDVVVRLPNFRPSMKTCPTISNPETLNSE